MLSRVYVHPKVEKTLEQMKTKEKAPSIAAKRAWSIIRNLVKNNTFSQAGLLSKKKDARIKNLFKFNLGSGYRLVCIKEKDSIHVLFAGSHDNCDTWLDRYSSKSPHKTNGSMNVYGVDTVEASDKTGSGKPESAGEIDCDSFLVSTITQEDLKKVFKGLAVGQASY
ncbi:MAG: hypothetical protein ABIJ31_10300 [Pseudomonadota bacterium]